MNHRRLTFAGLFALAMIFAVAAPKAHEYRIGAIQIGQPWARATAGTTPTGAAFLTVTNSGKTGDRLVGARSPIAERVEIHRHVQEDGVARMRPVAGGLDLPPGQKVTFEPGGLHLMLIGLKRPLVEGEQVPMTLTFDTAGEAEVELTVESIAAMGADHDHGG